MQKPARNRTDSADAASGRRVSMADVAALAGVSQQTVSRVANGHSNVNEQTRQRVQEAMAQLGFRPNYAGRSLRDGRYRSVGLVAYDITLFGNMTMLDGIASAAREYGYAITLIELDKDEPFSLAAATQRMAEQPVDGMIIGMSRMATDFETFTPHPGLSTVIVTMYAHPRCTTVDSDHYGCSFLVMKHLFRHGHTHIRYIGGPDFSIDNEFREAGYRDALAEELLEAGETLYGDWTANSGYELTRKLIEEDPQLTAIYAGNDQMALGAIAALQDAGKSVPEDVSVVGIDDSLEATVPHVPLTTVRFDLGERGRKMFEYAVPESEAAHQIKAIRIPGKLIERSSVADARR